MTKTPSSREISSTSNALVLAAVRRLLRPLVRLLLRYQIGYPAIAELLKALYVDVAEKEFRLEDKAQSDSRLHVLTGIHRRDVKRLRHQTPEKIEVPLNISVGGQAVSRWTTDPDWLDESGQPIALPRRAQKDGGPSFDRLVSSISKDIRPRTLLDEWLRIGVVALDDDDRVHLQTSAFIPRKGFEEKLYYLGRNLHDHIAACDHNVAEPEDAWFERSVNYPSLLAEDVEILRQRAAELGSETLLTLNAMAVEMKEKSKHRPGRRERVNFGAYFYKEPAREALPQDDEDES